MWWRYAAGGGALLAAGVAGVMLMGADPSDPRPMLAAPPPVRAGASGPPAEATAVPEATAATREERRFNRYDRDRDATVTREEYLAARRKAFARLDVDGDGRLGFDEWAIKATTKFAAADGDKSGGMNAAEFATTAVKRKPATRPKCPPQSASAEEG